MVGRRTQVKRYTVRSSFLVLMTIYQFIVSREKIKNGNN